MRCSARSKCLRSSSNGLLMEDSLKNRQQVIKLDKMTMAMHIDCVYIAYAFRPTIDRKSSRWRASSKTDSAQKGIHLLKIPTIIKITQLTMYIEQFYNMVFVGLLYILYGLVPVSMGFGVQIRVYHAPIPIYNEAYLHSTSQAPNWSSNILFGTRFLRILLWFDHNVTLLTISALCLLLY